MKVPFVMFKHGPVAEIVMVDGSKKKTKHMGMVASYKCRMCIFLGQTPGSAHDCGEGEDDGPQSGKTLGPRRKYSTTPISIGKKFEWENCIEILFGSLNSEPIDRKIWVAHFEFYGPLSPFTDLPHTNQESGSLSPSLELGLREPDRI